MQSLCRLLEDAPPLGLFGKNVRTMMISAINLQNQKSQVWEAQICHKFARQKLNSANAGFAGTPRVQRLEYSYKGPACPARIRSGRKGLKRQTADCIVATLQLPFSLPGQRTS